VIKLLNRDPVARLGARGALEIQQHDFFAGVEFKKLLQKKYAPPFRPTVVSASISLLKN
jgi:serum/glucocorticoid-regulated kinase 2